VALGVPDAVPLFGEAAARGSIGGAAAVAAAAANMASLTTVPRAPIKRS